MDNISEGMEQLDRLIKWTKRKRIVKSLLRGLLSIFFLAISAFCVIFSLEKGFKDLITFLTSLLLQFTLVGKFSHILTILGYLICLLLVILIVLTVVAWFLGNKVEKISNDRIVI